MAPADLRQRNNIVNCARVRSSRRGHNAERPASLLFVSLDGGFQLLYIDLHIIIHRDAANGFTAQAQQPRRFIQRVVRFHGGVKDRLRPNRCDALFDALRKVSGQGQSQRAEVGLVSAAGKGSVEGPVPTDALPDPAHGFIFDLRGQL